MKKYLLLITIIGCSILFSCEAGYNETHKDIFKDQIWTKGEVIQFKPLMHEAGKTQQISIDLQHIYGYDIKGFEVLVKIVAPSGKEELAKTYYLKMKEEDGTAISQCSGDYCDLHQILEPNYTFQEQGEYSISVEQFTSSESVAGFLSLKLNIKDVK